MLICDVSYMASAKPHPATLGYRQWRKAKICLKSPLWLHFQVKYSMMFNKHRPVSILPLFSKSYKSSCIIDLCLSSIRTNFCLKISLSLDNKVAQILLLLFIWARLCLQPMMEKLCWGIFQFKQCFRCKKNNDILLTQLYEYRIREVLYYWFVSYLSERSLYVSYLKS